jgi:hypothetical protein
MILVVALPLTENGSWIEVPAGQEDVGAFATDQDHGALVGEAGVGHGQWGGVDGEHQRFAQSGRFRHRDQRTS